MEGRFEALKTWLELGILEKSLVWIGVGWAWLTGPISILHTVQAGGDKKDASLDKKTSRRGTGRKSCPGPPKEYDKATQNCIRMFGLLRLRADWNNSSISLKIDSTLARAYF